MERQDNSVAIAIIGMVAFITGCVTALIIFGKDISSLTNFVCLIIPNTVGLILISRKVGNVQLDTTNIKSAVNGQLTEQLNDIKTHVTSTVDQAVEQVGSNDNA